MRGHHCAYKGCRKIIPLYYRYCDEHNKQYVQAWHQRLEREQQSPAYKRVMQHTQRKYNQEQRNPEANAFYHSKEWRRVRNYVYSRDNATCQACGNIVDNRKIVDHIVPLRVDFKQRLDTNNLWLICYSCHSIKTKLENKMTENQLKHVGKGWWKKAITERG